MSLAAKQFITNNLSKCEEEFPGTEQTAPQRYKLCAEAHKAEWKKTNGEFRIQNSFSINGMRTTSRLIHVGKYFFLFPVLKSVFKSMFKWLKAIWKGVKELGKIILFIVAIALVVGGGLTAIAGELIVLIGGLSMHFTWKDSSVKEQLDSSIKSLKIL